MTDSAAKRGKPDQSRVNVNQLHELRFWSRKFKCTQLDLVLATRACPSITPVIIMSEIDTAKEHLKQVRKSARRKKAIAR